MTQTTFTDNVVVQGSRDTTQLAVQGNTTQTQPLQTWQDSGANPLAKVAKDGRYQTGDLNLGTPDALVEANASITLPSSRPQRGVQSLGRLTGALNNAVAWAVHELELLGTGGVSSLQTAIRGKITHNNSGTSGSAELRAGDFQAINQTGGAGTPVGKATGVRGTASNTPTGGNAYLAKAIGVEATLTNDVGGTITDASAFEVAPPTNAATITNLYGLKVPALSPGGTVTNYASAQLGDELEIKVQAAAPPRTPPSNFIKLYPKLVTGTPHLFARDTGGTEYDLSGGGSGTVSSVGLSMPPEFSVIGSPITSAGTLAVSKASQNPNLVYAGPASGAAAAPTFRGIVPADLANALATPPTIGASAPGAGFFSQLESPLVEVNSYNGEADLWLMSAVGRNHYITFYKYQNSANYQRWSIILDGVHEAGANSGSDFILQRSADDATLLGQITIKRSNGNIGIDVPPSTSYKVDVAGSVHASSFPVSSDIRFKENIAELSGALDKLKHIRSVAFDWNDRYEALGRSTGQRELGLIAQEVEAQFPELVSRWRHQDEDGGAGEEYLAVDYSRFSSVLLQAVKELDAKIDHLAAR